MKTSASFALLCSFLFSGSPVSVFPQKTTPVQEPVLPHPSQTMVVVGSAAPTPLAESPLPVLVLPVETKALTLATPLDLLREDSSISLEQRGAGGAQSDLVMRGGGFAQALVLLNGFRVSDSQSAHHNLDLPIPLEAMNSIQILHGAGSTLYGADALGGVADFVTAAPSVSSLRLRSGAGSFNGLESSLEAALARKTIAARLTASRNSSDGFIADRDYRNQDASLENWISSRLGMADLLFAASDRSFGADQFYGRFDSWERTKGWFASARQELGHRTVASFGYRRHADEFILERNGPFHYENNHVDGSWQASLRQTVSVAGTSLVLLGLESAGDSIRSLNVTEGVNSFALGIHARNRGAGYFDLDLRPAKRRWNLTAGVREELFSGGQESAFAPHLAASLRLPHDVKLRASGGYGFRLPTYTDLYYSDPTTVGNAKLEPESAWTGDAGIDWVASSKLWVTVTGFYSRQHDAIDYVRTNSTVPWKAANLRGLRFTGVESSLSWLLARGQKVRVAWTALSGAQDALHGMQSEYVFNYPVNNVHASWTSELSRAVILTNSVQIVERYHWSAYPVWNASATLPGGRFHPYLRLDNLANTGYQEIAGVPMPGRSICGGVSVSFGR